MARSKRAELGICLNSNGAQQTRELLGISSQNELEQNTKLGSVRFVNNQSHTLTSGKKNWNLNFNFYVIFLSCKDLSYVTYSRKSLREGERGGVRRGDRDGVGEGKGEREPGYVALNIIDFERERGGDLHYPHMLRYNNRMNEVWGREKAKILIGFCSVEKMSKRRWNGNEEVHVVARLYSLKQAVEVVRRKMLSGIKLITPVKFDYSSDNSIHSVIISNEGVIVLDPLPQVPVAPQVSIVN